MRLSRRTILEQQPFVQLGHGVSVVGAAIVIDADELLVQRLPTAFWIARTISRDCSTGMTSSASPWKHQQGTSLRRPAMFVFQPWQIGTIADQRPGSAAARLHVPWPPMETPVSATRFGSTRY